MMINLNLKKVVLIMTFTFNVLIVYSQWHQLSDPKPGSVGCPIGNGKFVFGEITPKLTPSSLSWAITYYSDSDFSSYWHIDPYPGSGDYNLCYLSGFNSANDSTYAYVRKEGANPSVYYTFNNNSSFQISPKATNGYDQLVFSNCITPNNVYSITGKNLFSGADTMFFIRYTKTNIKTVSSLTAFTQPAFYSAYTVNESDKLYFINDSVGYFKGTSKVNSDHLLIRTMNYGQTWTNITPSPSIQILNYSFPSSDTGYVLTQTGVLKTTNGGQSWTSIVIPSTASFNCIKFESYDIGYIGGTNGALYKTNNGGSTWIAEVSNTTASIYKIYTFGNVAYFKDGTQKWYKNSANVVVKGNVIGEKGIEIYPNPSRGKIYINLSEWKTKFLTIEIMNLLGEKVSIFNLTELSNQKEQEINLRELNNGTYFINVIGEKSIHRGKIIITK